MQQEWWLFCALLAAGALPVVRYARGLWRTGLALVLLIGLGTAYACFRDAQSKRQTESDLAEHLPHPARPGGYVSSDTCRACHPAQYQSWHRSFHRTMTQRATPDTVRGPFDDVTLKLAGESIHLTRTNHEFWVELTDPGWKYKRQQTIRNADDTPSRPGSPSTALETQPSTNDPPPRVRRRIGMLTGSHHMQAYWIPDPDGNRQFSLPFTFLFEANRWVPRNDVFLLPPETPPFHQVWNVNCLNCHTTAGQPRTDSSEARFQSRVAELGIGCEACHGPAESHVRAHANPLHRWKERQRDSADPTILNPLRLSHTQSSEICSQCHAIRYINDRPLWRQEGHSYRPGQDIESTRPTPNYSNLLVNPSLPPELKEDVALWESSYWPDGMVRVSGREFNGMKESGCYRRGELSCLSCHSLHRSDPNDQLAADMEGNQACLQCHSQFAQDLTRHTHHPAKSPGSLCYNCHMPHTTYGLIKAIRSHLIDSPSVQPSLKAGRPNACNLCHLDQSLDWTARHLHQWFQQPLPPLTPVQTNLAAAVVWALSGDAGQRVLIAWHMGWSPARQASGQSWLAPYLATLLADPYSVVRFVAQRSLKSLPAFEAFPYDYLAGKDQLQRDRESALHLWQTQMSPTNTPQPQVLLLPNRKLDPEPFQALLIQRDDRAMTLRE